MSVMKRGRAAAFAGRLVAAGAGLGVALAVGCSSTPAARAPEQEVAAEPLLLLPEGAFGYARIDAAEVFRSSAGARLGAALRERVPAPAALDFRPERDLSRLDLGLYAFQGLDFVVVLQGRFAVPANGSVAEPGGAIVEETYAGKQVFLSASADRVLRDRLAYSVVAPSVALFGNETAVRRALERLVERRLTLALPELAARVSEVATGAAAGGALDLSAVPTGLLDQVRVPLVPGLRQGAVVANFAPPGLNLAVTLTYDSNGSAASAANAVSSGGAWLASLGPWAGLLGLGRPVHRLEARAEGQNLYAVAALDPEGLLALARLAGGWTSP